jgi:hypothetical protein
MGRAENGGGGEWGGRRMGREKWVECLPLNLHTWIFTWKKRHLHQSSRASTHESSLQST